MQLEMSEAYESRCDSLLQRAQGGQWDPDERLDWSTPPDLAAVSVVAPLISERLQAAWPGLDPQAREAATRNLGIGGYADDLPSLA